MQTTVKHTRWFLLIFLFPILASGQSPTLVQHVSCPNGRQFANQQSNTPDYTCPLPEPAQAGNTIIVGVVSANSGSYSLSDDKGDSFSLVNSVVDGNNAYVAIYKTTASAGARILDFQRTSAGADAVSMSASEYYNVGAVDGSSCRGFSGSSGTITGGSMTTTVPNDLLWQWAINAGGGGSVPNSVSSFTAGSQSNITWQLLGTSLFDGNATQAGVQTVAGAINPTFTSGSSQNFSSCAVALKAVTAGQQNPQPFRVLHMLHEQWPQSGNNPSVLEFPSSGNLVIVSMAGGGSLVSGISSNPANSWSATGPGVVYSGGNPASQIYYAANATTSSSMTLNVTRNNNVSDGTYMMYDVAGAAASPFDKDSGGQAANQATIANPFTTCTNCLTPSASNELIIANAQWNWCTANGASSPNGSLFDASTDTVNSVNGPEYVDQNGGWLHFYDPNTNPVTITWSSMACTQAEGGWAGRDAAFKSGGSVAQQPAAPTQLKAMVN
jgi:hypothetical protein